MKVLENFGIKDINILDEIEILDSLLRDSVSSVWNIDQFSIERNRYSIGIYFIPEKSQLNHPAGEELLARYFQDFLMRSEKIRLQTNPEKVSSFAKAFNAARDAGTDYFILMSFFETDRAFSALCDIYKSSTGALMSSFDLMRTGNDRVKNTLEKIALQVESKLPLWGALVKREFDQGIVSLGTLDGLKKDMKFSIVRKGSVFLKNNEIGIDYRPEQVLGEFTVTAVDDLVAQGQITKKGFFDMINISDDVVLAKEEKKNEQVPTRTYPALYNRLLKIR